MLTVGDKEIVIEIRQSSAYQLDRCLMPYLQPTLKRFIEPFGTSNGRALLPD
jgi:hypothetical protein